MRITHVLASLIAAVALPQAALALPGVYVYSEEQNDSLTACGLAYTATMAAAKSALRQNGATMATREEAMDGAAVKFYINMMAIEGEDGCSTVLRAELHYADLLDLPFEDASASVYIEHCDKTSLFTGDAEGMQKRINDKVREMVAACLSEYEDSLS
jgi:hypothetical protein